MNPEQLKAALRSAGYVVMSEGGGSYGSEPGDPFIPGPTTYYYFGPRGRASATEAAAAIGVPEATLTSMESRMVATPEESSSLYPSRSDGGVFGGFFEQLQGLVTSPQFALAASVVAPSILAAEAAGAAALASGAEGLAVPAAAPSAATPAAAAAPAATAFPVATSPLAAPSVLASDTLGASLSGLTSEQIAAATSANALAPAAATAAGAAVPGLNFEQIAAESLGANVPGVAEGVSGSSVFTPATTATTAVTNALTPTLNHEQIAAESLGANVTGAATGVSGASTFLPGTTGLTLDALSKFAKDYGVPLSALISGITGSQAAQSAADTQARSAAEARQLARDIFNEQKALQEPFRTAGITAQNQLLTLLGLPGGTQGAEYGKYARPFGMQDFQADPGYAFRLSEGMKALEASRAAQRGGSTGLLSGATGKALQRYGQDLASQEYGNAFNRFQTERVNRLQPLGALMGTGQAAASNQGAAAGQYGQTAGALTTDIGAARAAGDVGAANAITNALGQYSRYLSNQNIANQIRQSMYGAAIPG